MWQSFLWILTIVVLVGIFGNMVSFPGVVVWYSKLCKPVGNPPDWLFSVIWPIMYLLLILSTYFGYESVFPGIPQSTMMVNFILIAILIALWPYFFFYHQSGRWALFIILLLLLAVTIQIYIILVWLRNPIASALLVPLWLWVIYASYLNAGVVGLNPDID